jgi:hypothetical protein
MGLHRAGFDVKPTPAEEMDIKPQPRYPFHFSLICKGKNERAALACPEGCDLRWVGVSNGCGETLQKQIPLP